MFTLLLVLPATASGASIQIGAVDEIAAAAPPSDITGGGFAVQVAEAKGSYAVPEGYDTITAWSHSTGGTAGALTFKVYRPTGNPREYLVVGVDTEQVAAGAVESFPVHIAVQPGDRIGLSSDDVELAYETADATDRIGFFGSDPAADTTASTDGNPFPEFKLDVAATLESTPPPAPVVYELPLPPSPKPVISKLRMTPRRFAALGDGPSAITAKRRSALVTYRLDVAAQVRFTFRRVRRSGHGTREVKLPGTVVIDGLPGANRFRFTGRLRARRLAPGSYVLYATPVAAGVRGSAAGARFRILK